MAIVTSTFWVRHLACTGLHRAVTHPLPLLKPQRQAHLRNKGRIPTSGMSQDSTQKNEHKSSASSHPVSCDPMVQTGRLWQVNNWNLAERALTSGEKFSLKTPTHTEIHSLFIMELRKPIFWVSDRFLLFIFPQLVSCLLNVFLSVSTWPGALTNQFGQSNLDKRLSAHKSSIITPSGLAST